MSHAKLDRLKPWMPDLRLCTPLVRRLASDDDPSLWDTVLNTVLHEIDVRWESEAPSVRNIHVGMFKVARWRRPHQSRWVIDGPGFANPESYTHHPDQSARWGVWLSRSRDDIRWSCQDTREPTRRKKRDFVLRLSIPAYSIRHEQAAIAGEWRPAVPWLGPGKMEGGYALYGFRRTTEGWALAGHQESEPRRLR